MPSQNKSHQKPVVLLAGQAVPHLAEIFKLLKKQPDIRAVMHTKTASQADPLHGVKTMPDILVLYLGENWQEQLDTILARPASTRPAMLAIGPSTDMEAMRQTMRAGARDFLTYPVNESDLSDSIAQITRELNSKKPARRTKLTAVINAKGGSGATLLASNLAYIISSGINLRTAVIDMDLQFGALPLYLDLMLVHSLSQALESIESLDAIALEGYMTKHESGLHVLGAMQDEVILPGDVYPNAIKKLLDLARGGYQHVVVDLPRQIDPVTTSIMENADQILIVMQQSVMQLRDAKRLVSILTNDLEIPESQIKLVVNRYLPNEVVTIDDINDAFGGITPVMIPNDFQHVSTSINTGIPLWDSARKTPITKELLKLAEKLCGKKIAKERSLLKRAFSALGS